MAYSDDGYQICRGLIAPSKVESIRQKMLTIMAPFCDIPLDQPDSLDKCFSAISERNPQLKNNLYKLFGRLADLPLLLADDKIKNIVEGLGFTTCTIQAYSIFFLEPGDERHLFLPHQDLKDRTSLKSLLIWVPLSGGPNLGGLAVYPGTHKLGPVGHDLSPTGQLRLQDSIIDGYEKVSVTDLGIGDCAFLSPYLVHESIVNTGQQIRWTAIVKIDDATAISHAVDSIHPFAITDYIDTRSNEDRLAVVK